MPHHTLPETWVDAVLGVVFATIVGALGWTGRVLWGHMAALVNRIETLERLAAVSDVRHTSNIERLMRIEDKLDRLIERT